MNARYFPGFIPEIQVPKFRAMHWVALSALAVYYAFEAYCLVFRHGAHTTDLALYRAAAMQLLEGKVPYRDFNLEYPICAIPAFILPQILSRLFGNAQHTFSAFFAVQNLLLATATVQLVSRLLSAKSNEFALKCAFLSSLALPLVLFRYDIFPTFLTALAARYLLLRPAVSGFAWVVAAAAKLYAVVLFPVLALFGLINRAYRALWKQILGGVAAVALIVAAFTQIGTEAVLTFLGPHLLRGVHLESVAGGILLLIDFLGGEEVTVSHNYGAFHLNSSFSPGILSVTGWLTPVLFLAQMVCIAWVFMRERKSLGTVSMQSVLLAFTLQLLLFILLNKVFSPQYLIWLLPFAVFASNRSFAVFSVILMTTTIIFPGQYFDLIAGKSYMILLLNVRNILLIGLFIQVLTEFGSGIRGANLRK